MATPKKWKHQERMLVSRRGVKVQCACGAQSPLFDGDERQELAQGWYVNHVGLKEVGPKHAREEW